jgi:25S rRNA (adenine2142-N1)-methyltransferase
MQPQPFNVVCLSLVINFVPDAALRGLMLLRTREFLSDSGLLYVVLPLPCLNNSRYLTHELFVEILKSMQMELEQHHFSNRIAFYLFRRNDNLEFTRKDYPKKLLKPKGKRNNFCIVVKH